ncbi:atrial natriuretic peptide receptor 1-like [Ptychodera flava]|uniref:atrial natriuretic peptide receptor 1-like n=1 Tax=Ptychodera flava TaxID=63121 RepID=UPI00396A02CB
MSNRSVHGTPGGDVYSFGIILQEIIQRKGAFPLSTEGILAKDIVNRVRSGETPPFRPLLLPTLCEPQWYAMILNCLNENPEERPTFASLKKKCININNGEKPKVLENMLAKMEKYNDNLEELVEDRTQQFIQEKKKTDLLLYRMLPQLVADKLKAGLQVDPEAYEEVTIFFSDICHFGDIASGSSPVQVVDLLNDVYSCFDEIIEKARRLQG